MDDGAETIGDADERAAVQRQARVVFAKSVAAAIVATAAAWALP